MAAFSAVTAQIKMANVRVGQQSDVVNCKSVINGDKRVFGSTGSTRLLLFSNGWVRDKKESLARSSSAGVSDGAAVIASSSTHDRAARSMISGCKAELGDSGVEKESYIASRKAS